MTKKLHSISIVIPALNEELYLPNCLQALKNQDYQGDFEVIVVDNNSEDNTVAIAKEYGAKVVRENVRALSTVLRSGCDKAQNEIIAIIDSDTKVPAHWLSRLNQVFNCSENIIAADGPYKFYDAGLLMGIIFNRVLVPIVTFIYQKFFHARLIGFSGTNISFRRNIYQKSNGFVKNKHCGHEAELFRRLAKWGRIVFVPKLIVNTSFRRYSGGYSLWFLVLAHAFKESIIQIYRFALSSLNGRNFPLQKPIRTLPWRNWQRWLGNLGFLFTFLVIFFTYGFLDTNAKVFGATISHGYKNLNQKSVALTFDDGPNGDVTNKILDILKANNVHATFFVTGEHAKKYPDILKREVQEGNEIGNHTFDHPKTFPFLKTSSILNSVNLTNQIIYNITGYHTHLFRPPHGWKTPTMIRALHKVGYEIVLWNNAPADYNFEESPDQITSKVLNDLKPGTIIDLHDGVYDHNHANRDNLIAALPDIIQGIRDRGYTLVTIDEITNFQK